jgi:DNA-binding CsgD family transcriptional regulator
MGAAAVLQERTSTNVRSATPRLPPLQSLDEAKAGTHEVGRLMAYGLEWLARCVSAPVAMFSPVDRRSNLFTDGPLVVRHEWPIDLYDLARARMAYLRGVRAWDPFAPSRWSQSTARVVGVRDAGGPDVLARSSYGEFLASYGLANQTSIFLLDGGRTVAAIVLLRRRGEPELTAAEMALLRRAQPLLEQVHGLVRERPAPAPVDVLHAAGLTPREIEVARLAAAGATNAEIARALFLSVATVKTHVSRVLTKTGARSRTELVLLVRGVAPEATAAA